MFALDCFVVELFEDLIHYLHNSAKRYNELGFSITRLLTTEHIGFGPYDHGACKASEGSSLRYWWSLRKEAGALDLLFSTTR